RGRPPHQRPWSRGLPRGLHVSLGACRVNHAARLQRLAEALPELDVEALLVTDLTNVRYLTGYTGSNGAVVVGPDESVFLTDFRYLERVAPLRDFVTVTQANQDLTRAIGSRPGELAPGAGRVGCEAAHMSVASHAV